jgi:enoyl-CoA hydratase/carnithine racemase
VVAVLTEKSLRVEIDAQIAVVTLNRPERRNALSLGLMRELTGALRTLATDGRTRVIILRSTGPAFSAGHDLSELVGQDEAAYGAIFDACVELMETVQRIPQPVIAEVAGLATAAGCQLVATCDLAIAAEEARFATPGVKIGLFCSTPMVALSRAIGRKRALQMLLTGQPIDAATAAEWGLVNQVVVAAELGVTTRMLAAQIAEASGYTVKLGKQAFYRQIDLPQPEAYRYTRDMMVANTQAPDAQEGMTAFLEKRQPVWSVDPHGGEVE